MATTKTRSKSGAKANSKVKASKQQIISNYGILWQRKFVHFGAAGNKGNLLGKSPGAGQVDFREQIGIYVLYDKNLVAVYVGQAGNGNATLFSRLKAHSVGNLRGRWDYFSWFGLRHVNPGNKELSSHDHADKMFRAKGGRILNLLEGVLIAATEPRLNKQGAKFQEAQRFTQVVDENVVELSLRDVIDAIEETQKELASLKKQLSKSKL